MCGGDMKNLFIRHRMMCFLAILALVLMSECSRSPEGEKWAKSQLGAEESEKLRAKVSNMMTMQFKKSGPKHASYRFLPRPYIVFEIIDVSKQISIVYAQMNKDLGFNLRNTKPRGAAIILNNSKDKDNVIMKIINFENYTICDWAVDKTDASRMPALLNGLPETDKVSPEEIERFEKTRMGRQE
jgi:hypothetical protein